MKLTLSAALFIVAIVLFLAAALVGDGHIAYGSVGVLTDVGLAVATGGLLAHQSGK